MVAKYLLVFWFFLLLPPIFAEAADSNAYADILKKAKPATALMLRPVSGVMGTAFCIDSHGLFVTTGYSARETRPGEETRLIFNSGTPDQKSVYARVIRVDQKLDVALLQAEVSTPWPALELGSDEQFTNFDDVLVLSFPPPTEPKQYPAVVAKVETRSSFRFDASAFLGLRVYGSFNPENRGHPLIDRTGKVVGLVIGVTGGDPKSMAIPARRIRQLLASPLIYFDPPLLTASNRHEALPFSASPVMLGYDAKDLHADLELSSKGEPTRRFRLQKDKTDYRVSAIPFPTDKDGWNLHIAITCQNGSAKGKAKEQDIQIGNDFFVLSRIRSIVFKPEPVVRLNDGREMHGAINLKSLKLKMGEQIVNLNLRDAVSLYDTVPPESDFLQCSIILSDGDREIARLDQNDYLNGTPPFTMQSLRLGKFNKPALASEPTTYVHVDGREAYMSGGQAGLFNASEISFFPADVAVGLKAGEWQLVFSPPHGEKLSPGEYRNVKDQTINSRSPGIAIRVSTQWTGNVSAEFVIWELEQDKGVLKRVALDFICRNLSIGLPIHGSIRYNSTFQ